MSDIQNKKNNNFSKLLQEKNIKPSHLAKELGMSAGLIGDYLSGRSSPTGERLAKIAEYFDVSPAFVLGHSDNRNEKDTDPTDEDIKFALFGDREADDEVYAEVKELAAILIERHKNKNANG
jgi:Predicted transcriptional regulators